MEISDVSDKEVKIMVVKPLTEVKRPMHKPWEFKQRDRKYNTVPNRNHRAEEYNCTKKFNRVIQTILHSYSDQNIMILT